MLLARQTNDSAQGRVQCKETVVVGCHLIGKGKGGKEKKNDEGEEGRNRNAYSSWGRKERENQLQQQRLWYGRLAVCVREPTC